MNRVNKILENEKYKEYLNRINMCEKDRIFCRHTLQHFIDVSRVAYILSLEKNLSLEKEIIYAAGLLHDIGRFMEYEENIDHAVASAHLCVPILEDSLFSQEEIGLIKQAIKSHRNKDLLKSDLDFIIYEADKKSRLCLDCKALKECKKFKNTLPKLTY
ncbi:HD domain-containing protein [Anaeromicrobium sediminis]|uniref:HD/PDEase domain-containing protein n=1 Tax=Anaeromicrobium sediminis TaxID=1478221 RepID=A0A267MEN3_9FIRM|nr:HD domain-containing protein [Anaeromicrobium sediminis]PAB58041.1 hypothetical protein CCE28_17040 [Anaeromicrobium sediminis]